MISGITEPDRVLALSLHGAAPAKWLRGGGFFTEPLTTPTTRLLIFPLTSGPLTLEGDSFLQFSFPSIGARNDSCVSGEGTRGEWETLFTRKHLGRL